MQRLNSFDFIRSEQPMKYLEFPYQETTHEAMIQLMQFGFDMEIIAGRVLLKFDKKAISNLIAEELDYMFDNYDELEDFMDFKEVKFFSTWKEDWFSPYIEENRTLQDVIDDIKTDWVLTEEEQKQLAKKRNDEYNDDPKNFPELN